MMIPLIALVMSFLAPIVIATFFGYVFGGNGGKTETSRIPILVVDKDSSDISREIIKGLTADKALEVKPATLADARNAVGKGKATAAIVLPKDFGANAGRAFFRSNEKPEIGLLYDPSHRMEMSMVQGMLTGEVMQVVSKEMFGGKSGLKMADETLADVAKSEGLDPATKATLTDLLGSVKRFNEQSAKGEAAGNEATSGGLSTPYKLREEPVTSGKVEYNGYAHSFGGMGIQFILFMGIDAGIGVLLQRQRGLWKRLRAAPISRGLLLTARVLSAAIISMIILAVIFTFARVALGVRIEGSYIGFAGICLAFSLMTGTFGLLIAALGKTAEAARGLAVFVTLLLVMLGGAWVPTFIFPQWMQAITKFVPTRWAMDGLDAMTWRGLGFDSAMGPIAVLLLFAAIFGSVAVWQFRWDAEG